MDATQITSLISSIGFPIVMCLMMFKYIGHIQEAHSAETKELSNQISELKLVISEIKTIVLGMKGGESDD